MFRLLVALLLVSSYSFADTITIGTMTYVGNNSQGGADFQFALNTTGVTATPYLVNVGVGNEFGGATYGPFSSVSTFTVDGIRSCPCSFISAIAWFPNDATLVLTNGESFIVWRSFVPLILPLPGQSTVIAGQSTPIIIASIPEPATAFMFVIGLSGLTLRMRFSLASHRRHRT